MEKPKMSIDGLKYRLRSLEENTELNKRYQGAGFINEVVNDVTAIIKGFEERDTYIQYLEIELAKEKLKRLG
jgi:hypothetical protein